MGHWPQISEIAKVLSMHILKPLLVTLFVSCLSAQCPAFAQESIGTTQEFSVEAAILEAKPPQRAALAKQLLGQPKHLEALDALIASLALDDPRIPAIHSTLSYMPIAVKGPKIVELAKKCTERSGYRAFVEADLSHYPKAYAHTLASWLSHVEPDSSEYYALLAKYFKVSPQDAARFWVKSIENLNAERMESHRVFASQTPGILSALLERLEQTHYEAPNSARNLRLLSLLVQAPDGAQFDYPPKSRALILGYVDTLLKSDSVSERILALRLVAQAKLTERLEQVVQALGQANNATQRAWALEALHALNAQDACQYALVALKDKEATLRLSAAKVLADCTIGETRREQVSKAFSQEIWPEIAVSLYQTLRKSQANRYGFDRAVAKDPNNDMAIREMAMINSLQERNSAASMKDVAQAEEWGMSLKTCAEIVERVYFEQAEARSTVFLWIMRQDYEAPEIITLFASTLRATDLDTIPNLYNYLTRMCELYEHVVPALQQCLHTLEPRQNTPALKAFYQKLAATKAQYDAFWNADY